jgi:hypothetical protein
MRLSFDRPIADKAGEVFRNLEKKVWGGGFDEDQ